MKSDYMMQIIAATLGLQLHQKFRVIDRKNGMISPRWYQFKPTGLYTDGNYVMQEEVLLALITGAYNIWEKEDPYERIGL